VAAWLRARLEDGLEPFEVGVFVRTQDEFARAGMALEQAGLEHVALVDSAPQSRLAALGTMHDAKGLEFKAVAVMACDDDIVPLASRLVTAGEASNLEEINNTERHLLYVTASRAREHLWVSGVGPASEFLGDMVR
jgi:superfamily I DNA/RNA helicase